MLKVDMYVRIVLTVIAISLIGLLIKPAFNQEAQAQMSTGTGMGKYTIVVLAGKPDAIRLNTETGDSSRLLWTQDKYGTYYRWSGIHEASRN